MYDVDATFAGQTVDCQKCGVTFTITEVPVPALVPLVTTPVLAPAPAPSGNVELADNEELMRRARESLAGNWGTCILAGLIIWAISMAASFGGMFVPFAGNIASLLITGPFMLGMVVLHLNIVRRGQISVGQVFEGFNNFWRALCVDFLTTLFSMLWALLLIIPGIIAAYSYSMAFYILADNPGMRPLEAIRQSKEMMRGHKAKLFYLHCRFIGWTLLCVLTCGVGFLWFAPYFANAHAHFYENLRSGR